MFLILKVKLNIGVIFKAHMVSKDIRNLSASPHPDSSNFKSGFFTVDRIGAKAVFSESLHSLNKAVQAVSEGN